MFLVFKLPRSGSTLFGSVLNSHPEIACENELLNNHERDPTSVKLTQLAAFITEPPAVAEAKQIQGATINPYKYALTADDLTQLPGLSPRSSTRFGFSGLLNRLRSNKDAESVDIVLLERENKLKQAVSVYLSQERGSWESSLTNIKDKSWVARRTFDLPRLALLVVDLESQASGLVTMTRAVSASPLRVTYEALVAEPVETFNRVFTHIGAGPVGADFDFTAGHVKIASDDLHDIIDNYDDLASDPVLSKYT